MVSRDAFRCARCAPFELCPESAEAYRAALQKQTKDISDKRHAEQEARKAIAKRALASTSSPCYHLENPCLLCSQALLNATTTVAHHWAQFGVSELFHATHWRNVHSIARSGLLSRNSLRNSGIGMTDISLAGPQSIRASKWLEGKSIHDYVPLFFWPINAMTSLRRDHANELVLLSIDPVVMFSNGALTTDGNAAAHATSFWKNHGALPNIQWSILRGYWSEFDDGKRISQAETLIPHQIPREYVRKAYVRTPQLKDTLASQTPLPVDVRPDLFFSPSVNR